MPRVAFMGTPEVAVPTLQALSRSCEVPVVLTRPDRARGRSKRLQAPPVKVAADSLGLPVAQPERSAEIAGILESHSPLDAAVIVAYGHLIRPDALAVPARGMLNAHFSLLPRWRGAAPVQRAMLAGDARAGVSIMRLDVGLDTGPVLSMWSTKIGFGETAGHLFGRLADGAATLAVTTLERYLRGGAIATEQPQVGITYADKVEPTDRPIDWHRPAHEVVHQIMALSPIPGATTSVGGVPLKILAAEVLETSGPAGSITVDREGVVVAAGSSAVRLLEVQPAGKRAMDAIAWARGLHAPPGRVG